MIALRVNFRPGIPLYEQIVYAAKKAIVSGRVRPGDQFPSVRAISKELKVNPNTAHKVVAQLIASGLLEMRPGVGTVVAAVPESTAIERAQLLGREIEELAVEAIRLGIEVEDVLASIAEHWKRLNAGNRGDTRRQGGRK